MTHYRAASKEEKTITKWTVILLEKAFTKEEIELTKVPCHLPKLIQLCFKMNFLLKKTLSNNSRLPQTHKQKQLNSKEVKKVENRIRICKIVLLSLNNIPIRKIIAKFRKK